MTTELQTHGPSALGHDPVTGLPVAQPTITDLSPEGLIALAIRSNNLNVEALRELMTMRETLRRENAKRAYFDAFAQYQLGAPIIIQSKEVTVEPKDGGRPYRYRYAPIDRIIRQVGPVLNRHGFTWSFETVKDGSVLTVACRLTHCEGHSETSTFSAPVDERSRMSPQQREASTYSFCKRYAFCGVTGTMTGEEDDDAKKAEDRHPSLRNGDAKVTLVPDDQPKPKTRKPAAGAGSTISKAQESLLMDRVKQIAESYKVPDQVALQWLMDHCGKQYGVETLAAVSPAQATELLGLMLAKRREKAMHPEATL